MAGLKGNDAISGISFGFLVGFPLDLVGRPRAVPLQVVEICQAAAYTSHGHYCIVISFSFTILSGLLFLFDCVFYSLLLSAFMSFLFCITNEISFTIISLSSSDKFFLKSWFSSWNYYYITNYHWNLLRFTLYIRS